MYNKEYKYNDYFYCYSKNLQQYFYDNGLTHIESEINPNTNKRYWKYKSGWLVTMLLSSYKQQREVLKQQNII